MPMPQPRRSRLAVEAGAPLWRRVPVRDERGRPLADFLILIPRLRRRPRAEVEAVIATIGRILAARRDVVVFADLNLRLNVLWVSVRPWPGACIELAAAICAQVPGARLVAERLPEGRPPPPSPRPRSGAR